MKNYKEYSKHIMDEIIFIEKNSQDLTYDQFISNEILKRAFVRSIEIIGEAVKNIPNDVTDQYPQTNWKNIARMRDRLIHHYFGIDYSLLWDVICIYLPYLKEDIETILLEN